MLRCEGLLAMTVADTQRHFARAFVEYGLPDRMRSDNGVPFVSTGLAGLSRLAVWWIRLGIVPERIAPGRPDQNGSHEQFHAVLKAETTRPPAANLRAQQRRFDQFRRDYNDARPHEALNQETPASRYVPSRRAFPAKLPRVEYPGHMEVRRVSSSGCIGWCNAQPFVSETLSGEWIALEEVADGTGRWSGASPWPDSMNVSNASIPLPGSRWGRARHVGARLPREMKARKPQ